MTTLGLNYLNYEELKRSNLVKEAETNRANLEAEAVNRGKLTESIRSNKANEALTLRQRVETERSNRRNEALTLMQRLETERTNKANEKLKAEAQAETAKHNRKEEELKAYEVTIHRDDLHELIRHNMETEDYNRDKLYQDAWHTFSSHLNDVAKNTNVPVLRETLQLTSAGAALSSLKNLEHSSIVDRAVSDLVEELTAASSMPDDPEERAKVEDTIKGIDAQARKFAAHLIQSAAPALEKLYEKATDTEKYLKDAGEFISKITDVINDGGTSDLLHALNGDTKTKDPYASMLERLAADVASGDGIARDADGNIIYE